MLRTAYPVTRSIILATALGLLLPINLSAQTYDCLAQGPEVTGTLEHVQRLVQGVDIRYIRLRDAVHLPAASPGDVKVETNRRRCGLAGDAYHRVLYPEAPYVDRTLVVLAVGKTHFVVYDISAQTAPNSEWSSTTSGSTWGQWLPDRASARRSDRKGDALSAGRVHRRPGIRQQEPLLWMFFDDPASILYTHVGTHRVGLLQTDTLPSTFVMPFSAETSERKGLFRSARKPVR